MATIRIIADDRETNPLLLETLRNTADAEVAMQRLALGDYSIDGRLLFERKTLADLVASLKDGRLLEQACRLAAAPLYKAMILEGTSHDLPNSGMRREAIQGALVQVTLFLGVPVLRSSGPEESARLMLYAARQFQSLARTSPPRLFKGKRPRASAKPNCKFCRHSRESARSPPSIYLKPSVTWRRFFVPTKRLCKRYPVWERPERALFAGRWKSRRLVMLEKNQELDRPSVLRCTHSRRTIRWHSTRRTP